MWRKGQAVAMALFMIFASGGRAEAACYTSKEVRAEELLRLHSELMVITVTCQTSSDGTPLAPLYAEFTRKNKEQIQYAEAVMHAHYEKAKKNHGIKGVDRLRTQLANAAGQTMADMNAPVFCAKKRDILSQMNVLSKQAVEQAAHDASMAATALEPLCVLGSNSP